jgi:signal transduction histidine kinase
MLATVNEISDVAQLQMGGSVELALRPVDVAALVQAAAGIVADAGGRDAAPVFVKAPEGVVVEADQPRLERVLQNIIGNAVKYSLQATPVCVEVEACEQWVTIRVRDQGVGIPSDELPHIFRRFYRASTSTGVSGTGIGLAGSKTIVEQHGGQIAVESATGHGTTVTISLPRLAPAHRSARGGHEGVPA